MSVALIVLRADEPPSAFDGSMGSKVAPGRALTEIRRSGLSRPRTVSAGLTLMLVIRRIYLAGRKGVPVVSKITFS